MYAIDHSDIMSEAFGDPADAAIAGIKRLRIQGDSRELHPQDRPTISTATVAHIVCN